MKKIMAMIIPMVLMNSAAYSMKRPHPDERNALANTSGPLGKKREFDTEQPSIFTDELKRGVNNIYAPRGKQKIGGPQMKILDDKIVFE
jgi:hypothetical protein